jgi:O-6-methylguanine DNA methyltransferase
MSKDKEQLHYAIGDAQLGTVIVALSDHGVAAILIADDAARALRDLQAAFPEAEPIENPARAGDALASAIALIDRPQGAFAHPLDLRGSAGAGRLAGAAGYPAGETRSYGQLAKTLPLPMTAREVGAACAANRIAVAVPCHRVVKADGGISGYRWCAAQAQADQHGRRRMSGHPDLATQIAAYDWSAIAASLDQQGWAVLPGLLDHAACDTVAALYGPTAAFRSHVHMARHGFGKGEYRYFAYPLPALIEAARTALYPHIARGPMAGMRGWGSMSVSADHASFLQRCHAAGQRRPTPLLLQYGEGDYNCLHQDLYGDHVFPLQVAVLLSQPGKDFTAASSS